MPFTLDSAGASSPWWPHTNTTTASGISTGSQLIAPTFDATQPHGWTDWLSPRLVSTAAGVTIASTETTETTATGAITMFTGTTANGFPFPYK